MPEREDESAGHSPSPTVLAEMDNSAQSTSCLAIHSWSFDSLFSAMALIAAEISNANSRICRKYVAAIWSRV